LKKNNAKTRELWREREIGRERKGEIERKGEGERKSSGEKSCTVACMVKSSSKIEKNNEIPTKKT
jgi:hypothetical protein